MRAKRVRNKETWAPRVRLDRQRYEYLSGLMNGLKPFQRCSCTSAERVRELREGLGIKETLDIRGSLALAAELLSSHARFLIIEENGLGPESLSDYGIIDRIAPDGALIVRRHDGRFVRLNPLTFVASRKPPQ